MGGTHRGSSIQLSWSRLLQGCDPQALSFIHSRPGRTCGPVHQGTGEDTSPAGRPESRVERGVGQTVGALCQGKGKIVHSPAQLPSVPSALGGQTLPEALGGDLNIPYSRPQRAGVGGKRRGQSRRVSPYNSAPHLATFRLLRLPAASGTGLTGTRRSTPLHGWRPNST